MIDFAEGPLPIQEKVLDRQDITHTNIDGLIRQREGLIPWYTKIYDKLKNNKDELLEGLTSLREANADINSYEFQLLINRMLMDAMHGGGVDNLRIGRLRHTIPKSGSKMEAIYDLENKDNPMSGVIINTLPTESAKLWIELQASDIPVAPILSKGERFRVKEVGDNMRVFSRYCGTTYAFLQKVCTDALFERELSSTERESVENFLSTIGSMRKDVIKQMGERGFSHGHTHEQNFCIEFVNNDYVREMESQGHTVNTLPYDEANWSFDPNYYLGNQDQFTPVVRLIDFDKLRRVNEPTSGDHIREI